MGRGALLQSGDVSGITGKVLAVDGGVSCMADGEPAGGLLVLCMKSTAGGMGRMVRGVDLYFSLIRRLGQCLG